MHLSSTSCWRTTNSGTRSTWRSFRWTTKALQKTKRPCSEKSKSRMIPCQQISEVEVISAFQEPPWQIKLKLPVTFQKSSKKFKIPRFSQAPNTWAAISTQHCSTFLFIVNSWVLSFSFSCHFLGAWTSTPTFLAEELIFLKKLGQNKRIF